MILKLRLQACDDASKRVLPTQVDTEQRMPNQSPWRCRLMCRRSWMLMAPLGQTETHVAEIFCPGRFTVRARRFDLRPCTAMDLRGGYDFNKEADRMRARECPIEEKATLTRWIPTLRSIFTTAELAEGF